MFSTILKKRVIKSQTQMVVSNVFTLRNKIQFLIEEIFIEINLLLL